MSFDKNLVSDRSAIPMELVDVHQHSIPSLDEDIQRLKKRIETLLKSNDEKVNYSFDWFRSSFYFFFVQEKTIEDLQLRIAQRRLSQTIDDNDDAHRNPLARLKLDTLSDVPTTNVTSSIHPNTLATNSIRAVLSRSRSNSVRNVKSLFGKLMRTQSGLLQPSKPDRTSLVSDLKNKSVINMSSEQLLCPSLDVRSFLAVIH
jgi:hypothetical protein